MAVKKDIPVGHNWEPVPDIYNRICEELHDPKDRMRVAAHRMRKKLEDPNVHWRYQDLDGNWHLDGEGLPSDLSLSQFRINWARGIADFAETRQRLVGYEKEWITGEERPVRENELIRRVMLYRLELLVEQPAETVSGAEPTLLPQPTVPEAVGAVPRRASHKRRDSKEARVLSILQEMNQEQPLGADMQPHEVEKRATPRYREKWGKDVPSRDVFARSYEKFKATLTPTK